jgi:cyclophilin family peptidyl-prolyl cis-trans isomerase
VAALVLLVAARVAPAQPAADSLTPARQTALLRTPAASFWSAPAPDSAQLVLETSKGTIVVQLVRAWAPHGVDRLVQLARAGYFDDSRFYRVVGAFVAQFGLHRDPAIAQRWRTQRVRPDSVRTTNARGTLSFAQSSPRDRSTDLFINLRDNPRLDTLGFAPVGRVVEGMEVADALFFGYGDMPSSAAPVGNPRRFYGETNRWLDREYPKLDRIVTVRVR